MKLLKHICYFLFFVSPVFATAQTAKVSGKVIDVETGSPLAGASVTISEENGSAKKGVNTDVEGGFFVSLPVNKKYTIQVSSVGYTPKQLSEVEVTLTSNPVLNVSLEKSKKELGNVVVKATVRKEAQGALYSAQKNSSSISDGISAELIRKSPDKNTGDVLKRVSGTSVQDNKFVVIRGLNERYNVSMLNNSVLPSTEADKKAFAFDMLPSSLVDNIVIYKSVTPDLPGDFAGGAVKIFTKDYPARKINEVSFSMGFNTMTTGKNFYKGYPDGKYDALGFFDDSRLIPGSYYRNKNGFILNTSEFKREVTKDFPNTFGYEPANKSMPAFAFSYTGGNTHILKNDKKFGYIVSFGYSNGHTVSERDRNQYEYSTNKEHDYQYITNDYNEKNNMYALLNLAYSYKKSKISFKNIFNNTFIKTTGIRNGRSYETDLGGDPFYVKSANSEATGNGILNSVLEGLHKLGNNWTVDWNGSFGYTYRNQPDQRILAYRTAQGDNANYYLSLSNENSPEIRNAGRVYSYLGENIYGGSANVQKQFNWLGQVQKLKFGTMNYYRDRSVEVIALGYAALDRNRVQIAETKNTTFNNIFSPENIDNYNLTVASIETNSADYTGTALQNTGYVMLDNKFSDKIKLTWGARLEKYDQKLAAKNKQEKEYDNTDVLPSFLFTYAVTSKANIRVAGSQSVNRPEFRELADYSVYDYDNNQVIRGNPNLQRCKSTNADLRYEWFPAAGEIISASLFYKYFDKPIEQTNQGNEVLSYANADHAVDYGVEVELRKKLDFIGGGFFEHLMFYANASYIKGSVQFGGQSINSPLQGQSPYLINGGLNYTTADDGFSVNLLYNRIGSRLRSRAVQGAALNIYEKPRDVVDFQVSKKLFKNKLEAKITLSDILAQPYSWYYKYDANTSKIAYNSSQDKIINTVKWGTTALLEFRYHF